MTINDIINTIILNEKEGQPLGVLDIIEMLGATEEQVGELESILEE